MIDLFHIYGTAFLRICTLVCWLFILKKSSYKGINTITIKYFMGFLGIFIFWNISMIFSKVFFRQAVIVYLFFWVIVSIYEFIFIIKILFISFNAKKKHSEILTITISVLAIPIILSAILCVTTKSYNPINTTDFYNILLLMLCTIIIMYNLLSQKNFIENIESFFIFSGFVLYFGLHILASNAISLDFLQNWNFGQYATLISLVYWLGSTFVIWKIRSKHSF